MAVGDAHVFPGLLTSVLTQLFFKSHRLLFSRASAEVRGENKPERKFALTGYQTHSHQVMSPTRLLLSHPGRVKEIIYFIKDYTARRSKPNYIKFQSGIEAS